MCSSSHRFGGLYGLGNLGQGHGVQHSQLTNSMANINVYENRNRLFALALTVFQILAFQILCPWSCRSRSRWPFSMKSFDGKYMTSYLIEILMFAVYLTIYVTLGDLGLNFQVQTFDALISHGNASVKCVILFIDFNICHQMTLLRMLCSSILTVIFKAKYFLLNMRNKNVQ